MNNIPKPGDHVFVPAVVFEIPTSDLALVELEDVKGTKFAARIKGLINNEDDETVPDGKIHLIGKPNGWNWHATWKLHENELSITYHLFQEQGRQSEPENRGNGFVRWDGCSGWDVGGHFCSQRECVELGQAIALCWQHAQSAIGHKWDHSEEDAVKGLKYKDYEDNVTTYPMEYGFNA